MIKEYPGLRKDSNLWINWNMSKKQIFAIIAPIILVLSMYPVFHFLSSILGSLLGWYLGLVLYWIIWGAVFPLWVVGKTNILRLIRPHKFNLQILLLVSFPLVMASLSKLITGMEYEIENLWILVLYLSTAIGNGFFEEILWRGVYLNLFPNGIIPRIIWPCIWFTIWHYAPGSVSANSNVIALMAGAGVFGIYLSFLAHKTKTIWWGIVAHTLGGFVMVL